MFLKLFEKNKKEIIMMIFNINYILIFRLFLKEIQENKS
jgi:hypothetical protein